MTMYPLFAPTFALFLSLQAVCSGAIERYELVGRQSTNVSAIQWGSCDPNVVVDPSLSCGFFEIPIDYHDASAGKGRIAVVKANATRERRGTFFFNPGGPGESGLSAMGLLGQFLVNVTGGFYDVVSWDPRGVGALSIPGDTQCFNSMDEYNTFFKGTIELSGIEMTGTFTNQSDIDALLAQADTMQKKYEEVGKLCQQRPEGKYLKYIGTAATVRDMVAMADALDGPGSQVHYMGISYGTVLGSWLINMFPHRVGHVILDGVIDTVRYSKMELPFGWQAQLVDADKVYAGFVEGCALAGPNGCVIAKTGENATTVNATMQALLKGAYDAAYANASAPVTSGGFRTRLYPAMYWPSNWSILTNETITRVAKLIDQELSPGTNITKRSEYGDQKRGISKRDSEDPLSLYTTIAIMCSDSKDASGHTTMKDVFEDIIDASRTISPMFSSQWPAEVNYCAFWPERAVERYQGSFNKTLANRVLIIGNTYDPVTPFFGAKAVADLLGRQAALVRMNGFGHTSEASRSACVREVIFNYMVNGTLPEGHDTVCEVDDDFEFWTGVNTRKILSNVTL